MLSIIIPTFNEFVNIKKLLPWLQNNLRGVVYEVMVCDAGSTDDTVETAHNMGAKVILCQEKSRAHQMNMGAKEASYEELYFLHADVLPPSNFHREIQKFKKEGFKVGTFLSAFNSDKKWLKINAKLNQSKHLFYRGGGDQSLYIQKSFFDELGGFNEEMAIMEDFDLMRKILKKAPLGLSKEKVLVSDRKYRENPYFVVSFAYVVAYAMFRLSVPSTSIKRFYHCMVKDVKGEKCAGVLGKAKPLEEFCCKVKN